MTRHSLLNQAMNINQKYVICIVYLSGACNTGPVTFL